MTAASPPARLLLTKYEGCSVVLDMAVCICSNMLVEGAMVVDSMVGVDFIEQSFNTLANSVVMSYSQNTGAHHTSMHFGI